MKKMAILFWVTVLSAVGRSADKSFSMNDINLQSSQQSEAVGNGTGTCAASNKFVGEGTGTCAANSVGNSKTKSNFTDMRLSDIRLIMIKAQSEEERQQIIDRVFDSIGLDE